MADATSSPAPAATVVAASAAPTSARPAFLAAARPLLPRLPLARNPGPQVGHRRVAAPPSRGDTASGGGGSPPHPAALHLHPTRPPEQASPHPSVAKAGVPEAPGPAVFSELYHLEFSSVVLLSPIHPP